MNSLMSSPDRKILSRREILRSFGAAAAFTAFPSLRAATAGKDSLPMQFYKSLTEEQHAKIVLPLDVSEDSQIEACFSELGKHWDGFDILIHAIAFAPREAIAGQFLDGLTRENFAIAHDVSSYSLAAMSKAARPMMAGRKGAILTLTYLGAERALAGYNLMGLAKASLEANVRYLAYNLGPEGTRVNAISAGPIKTLAAAGIAGFRKILGHVEQNAPLRRTVTIEDVGNVAAFLCSDLAAGVTGEVTYVDAGYNILGMTGIEKE